MFSIIIPAFNSEDSIEELVNEIVHNISKMNLDYEILIIDDASKDSTWLKIGSLSKKNKKIKGFKFFKNYGQHHATLYGLKKSKGQTLITMDDDMQHSPKIIELLYNKYKDGNDLVYAKPTNKSRGFKRNVLNIIVKFILKIFLNIKYIKIISSYRMFDRKIIKKFENLNTSNVNVDSLLCLNAEKINFINYKEQPRKFGKSTYTFKKLVIHSLNLIVSFHNNPMTPNEIKETDQNE